MNLLAIVQEPGAYAAMAAIIFVAAFLQGVGGVGFAMFASPVAAVFFPELVPGPLLSLGGFVALMTALRERQHAQWPAVAQALSGRIVGSALAVWAMATLSPRPIALIFAMLILAAVGLSVMGLRIADNGRNMAAAGVISGIMGTFTSIGAPALAIVQQHKPPPALRATLGLMLFFGSLASLTLLAWTGHYTTRHLGLSLALLPFLLLGFASSNRARGRVSPATVRRMLLALCALSAVALLVRNV
ncbi:sulfite exporter TauE/SafE family protein [Bordetella ansorpii]|nr:sulfite exporter TauE/SafE family protein [Bordetella ansorpii]